ncbi:FAD-dependent monooxygenase [Actinosynnema sp. NPDC051121]|nr:FAD-dependent oxidoreductase [Saccharothrix sp.]
MDFDVVVAGAGPTGLMLACELRLHGAQVVVLERLTEPDTTVKAGSVNVPTVEALRRRGLLADLAAVQDAVLADMARLRKPGPDGAPPSLDAMRAGMRKIGGHFGGLFKLDPSRLDPADEDLAITNANAIATVPQSELERILADWAARLGVQVRRGVEVAGFTQDEDGVTVSTEVAEAAGAVGAAEAAGAGAAAGAAEAVGAAEAARVAGIAGAGAVGGGSLRARFLVGCDGGRSVVRKVAGFDFPGTEPTITGHQAMVAIDHPERLPTGWTRTDTGMLVHGPMPGRILTVEFDGPPADRDAPVTREELETSLRHVSGADVRITEVRSATRFTDNARQATTYRNGRVLLAGDAAHVHSPFGGQGLNLGLGDAVNLGWKLAAVATGRAPHHLLDTYTAERHPIGARVLEITRAQVALMRPGPHTTALREVVSDLIDTADGNAYFVKLIAGLDQHYDLPGEHRLVGHLMPLLDLADGRTTADHCLPGGPVLFDLADSADLRALAGNHARVVTTKAVRDDAPAALLVRPDGYVVWAADRGDGPAGLAEALDLWCPPPPNA